MLQENAKAGDTYTQNIKRREERQEHFLPELAHVPTPAITGLTSTQEDGNPEV